VPAGALFRTGDRFAVYVVEKGRAKSRTVEIGRRNGLAAQLLSGLNDGETVILHPGDTWRRGRRCAPDSLAACELRGKAAAGKFRNDRLPVVALDLDHPVLDGSAGTAAALQVR